MPPQATCSTGLMPGTAGRHMWLGLLHTCAGTRPPTAPLLSSGGTQHEPHSAQALGEWVLLCHVEKDGRVLPAMLRQAVERAWRLLTSWFCRLHRAETHRGHLTQCCAVVHAVLWCANGGLSCCTSYDWDSSLPGAAAVLAAMPTLSVSTAARDWLEGFVLAKWEVRGPRSLRSTHPDTALC